MKIYAGLLRASLLAVPLALLQLRQQTGRHAYGWFDQTASIAVPPTQHTIPGFPFSGVYSCNEGGLEAKFYSAAWLLHRDKFVRTVSWGAWWTAPFNATADMVRPGWSVGRDVKFTEHVNMEGASDIVLSSHHSGSMPFKTVDALAFAVEHLSNYEHQINLEDHIGTPRGQLMLRRWKGLVQRRVDELEAGWSPGVDAKAGAASGRTGGGSEAVGGAGAVPLWERVVAAIPVYINADGSGGYQKGSVASTRGLYLRATFRSVSRFFPNVVAFVATTADLAYCRNASKLPFLDVIHIPGLAKGTQLPMATLLEMQRRFRVNEDGWRTRFDHIYYTEADQVLRLRGDQLPDLLGHLLPQRDDPVLVPHRFQVMPTLLDFPGANAANLTAVFGRRKGKEFAQLGSKKAEVLMPHAQIQCCISSNYCMNDDAKYKNDWTDMHAAPKASNRRVTPPPLQLLRSGGSYSFLNGRCNVFKKKCLPCSIVQSGNCIDEASGLVAGGKAEPKKEDPEEMETEESKDADEEKIKKTKSKHKKQEAEKKKKKSKKKKADEQKKSKDKKDNLKNAEEKKKSKMDYNANKEWQPHDDPAAALLPPPPILAPPFSVVRDFVASGPRPVRFVGGSKRDDLVRPSLSAPNRTSAPSRRSPPTTTTTTTKRRFAGTFPCNDNLGEAYAAAWLTTSNNFVTNERLYEETLKPNHDPSLEYGAFVGMLDHQVVRTVDMFDFFVHHISRYHKKFNFNAKKGMADVTDVFVDMEAGYERESYNNPTGVRNGNVVAIMPFHVGSVSEENIAGRFNFLSLNLTVKTVSRVFPNIVLGVATREVYDFVVHRSGLNRYLYDVILMPDLINRTHHIPHFTSVRARERMADNLWDDGFEWVYYTETDQMPHLRDVDALLQVTLERDRTVLVPHRTVPYVHATDFRIASKVKQLFPNVLARAKKKTVLNIPDLMTSSCCYDRRSRCNNGDETNDTLYIPFDKDDVELFRQHESLAFVNGAGNYFSERYRLCDLSTNRSFCGTD